MKTELEIETGVAIPPRAPRAGGWSKYPFAKMEVGQSVAIPLGEPKQLSASGQVKVYAGEAKLRQAVSGFQRRSPGRKYTCRRMEGEGVVRAWRTA